MEEPLISVAALHALVYCERLFYLEEVERIRVADAAVFAGRRLHAELEAAEEGTRERREVASDALGLRGVVDVLRRRDGALIPYEHKRGRSAGKRGAREPWPSDRIQLGAYAMLVEESNGEPIAEGRIRYHADGATVRVPIDDALRDAVRAAVRRAKGLRQSTERPPVTSNERLCVRCSLAPVCLPEEARLADCDDEPRKTQSLPQHDHRRTLHIVEPGAQVGRSGFQLVVRPRDAEEVRVPIGEVGSVVLHGFAQITTQALRLCASEDVAVNWMTQTGGLVGGFAPPLGSAQRQLRQFEALRDEPVRLSLARRLVRAKVEMQLRFLLRATRGQRSAEAEAAARELRAMVHRAAGAADAESLLGVEGNGARAYFGALPELLTDGLDARLRFGGRNRRPPTDRFNAVLSYGYGLLYRQVLATIVQVGLHPGVGFYHRPRSSAHPLALDLMELFRVAVVDMAVVAAFNRRTFDADTDFAEAPGQVLLNESGRAKAIEVFEQRAATEWRHNVVGVSMSYARMIEMETRLLEKEWMGEGGLFARVRLR
jgi:CRISPR-associated protein Cas1